MKDVSTIEQACNGILLRSDEYRYLTLKLAETNGN